MDFERLRAKGWSDAELQHAHSIVHSVTVLDHLSLWMLTGILIIGSIGLAAFILPLTLFLHEATVPVSFLLGLCIGFLLTHALGSLRITRRHHLRSTMFLIAASFLAMLITTSLLVQRFRIIPGASEQNALLASVPYAIGVVVPYMLERRLHGSREPSPQERRS